MDKKDFTVKMEVVNGESVYKPTQDQARIVARLLDPLHEYLKMYKKHGSKRCPRCKEWDVNHKTASSGGYTCTVNPDRTEMCVSDKIIIIILESGEKVFVPLQSAKTGVDTLLEHWTEFCVTMRAEIGFDSVVLYQVRRNRATALELEQIDKLMSRFVANGAVIKEEK